MNMKITRSALLKLIKEEVENVYERKDVGGFNPQMAREVISIVKGLKRRGDEEVRMFEAGKLSASELVQIVSQEYYNYKHEELKKSIFGKEQIAKTAEMLAPRNKE